MDTIRSVAGGREKRTLVPDIILKQMYLTGMELKGSVNFYGRNVSSSFFLLFHLFTSRFISLFHFSVTKIIVFDY